MQIQRSILRSGFDGEKCLVHARMCTAPEQWIATAQYLQVSGCDWFSGIRVSQSIDGGRTWSEFVEQPGLNPIYHPDGSYTVGCDGTPLYHQKTGKVLLLGQTATYAPDSNAPLPHAPCYTFYSVWDGHAFSPFRLVDMPAGYAFCGNGSGQSVEAPNGDLYIPIYHCSQKHELFSGQYSSSVMRCTFDGETLIFQEIGNSLTIEGGRGLYEPSLIYHGGKWWMTLRNDYTAFWAESTDGLHFSEPVQWCWENGEELGNYNTQQHWMQCAGQLYLVYTRRGANNDHVFRHRAPLFAARVENGRLVRESEQILVPERGARLGNFGVCNPDGRTAFVMAAEWMQPRGCEQYGSDNAIFLVQVSD